MFTLQSGEFTKMSEAGTDSRTVEGLRQLGNCQARLAHRGQVGIDTDLPPTAMDGAALEVNNWNNEVWAKHPDCAGPKAILVRKGNVAFGGALCVAGPADFAGPLRVGGVAVVAEGAFENARLFAIGNTWDTDLTVAGGALNVNWDDADPISVNNRVGYPSAPFTVSSAPADTITVNNTGNYRISYCLGLLGSGTAARCLAKLIINSSSKQAITILVFNPCDLIAGVTGVALGHALTGAATGPVTGNVTGFAASQGATTGGLGGIAGITKGHSTSPSQLFALKAGDTVKVEVTMHCYKGGTNDSLDVIPGESWITIESTDGKLGPV